MNKAVFLDRDGTVIEDRHYLCDTGQVVLLPGMGDIISKMNKQGYYVIVISNQSGVARGYFDISDVKKVNDRINDLLKEYDARIDAFYYCPHLPFGTVRQYSVECNCRKPAPGLFLKAVDDFNLDTGLCFAFGDSDRDIISARTAGVPEKNTLRIRCSADIYSVMSELK